MSKKPSDFDISRRAALTGALPLGGSAVIDVNASAYTPEELATVVRPPCRA